MSRPFVKREIRLKVRLKSIKIITLPLNFKQKYMKIWKYFKHELCFRINIFPFFTTVINVLFKILLILCFIQQCEVNLLLIYGIYMGLIKEFFFFFIQPHAVERLHYRNSSHTIYWLWLVSSLQIVSNKCTLLAPACSWFILQSN